MFKLFSHVSRNEMKHTSRGIFKYKDRKPIAMVKGVHGEDNIRYLEKNKLEYHINEPFPNGVRNGSITTGYNVCDITYFSKQIRVSWHHAICDGRGIKPFIENLLYYYCSLKENRYNSIKQTFDSTNINLSDSKMFEDEMLDPFNMKEFERGEVKPLDIPREGYKGYALKENKEEWINDTRYEFDFDSKVFMKKARDIHATPSIYISMLMDKAIANLNPKFDLPIVCHLAIDTREALGLIHTHHNCVGSISLPFSKEDLNDDAKTALKFRKSMGLQKNTDYQRENINRQAKMLANMASGQTLDERILAFSPFSRMCSNTFALSYIGKFILNDYDYMVTSIQLVNSGVKGLRMNMTATDKTISLNIIKTFESEEIIEELIRLFKKEGLEFSHSGKIIFDTPKDKTQKTGKFQVI